MAINRWAPTTSIQNKKLNNDADEALAAFNLLLILLQILLPFLPLWVGLLCLRAFVHSFLLRVYLPVNQTRSPRGWGGRRHVKWVDCRPGGLGVADEMGHTAAVIKNLLIVHTADRRAEPTCSCQSFCYLNTRSTHSQTFKTPTSLCQLKGLWLGCRIIL